MIYPLGLPKVIIDNNCAKRIVTKRTWKERLFSWPWRPWVAETITYKPEMWKVGDAIICHPAIYAALNSELDRIARGDPPVKGY